MLNVLEQKEEASTHFYTMFFIVFHLRDLRTDRTNESNHHIWSFSFIFLFEGLAALYFWQVVWRHGKAPGRARYQAAFQTHELRDFSAARLLREGRLVVQPVKPGNNTEAGAVGQAGLCRFLKMPGWCADEDNIRQ